jgi:hypothetical protein
MTALQRHIYRAIVRLHPADFRDEFGREMALDFEDAMRDRAFAPLLGDALLSLARQWKSRAFAAPELAQPATGRPLLAGQYCAVDQGHLTLFDWASASVLSFLLALTIGFAATLPNRHAVANVQSVRVSHDGGIDTGGNGAPPAANPSRRERPGDSPDLTAPGAGTGPATGRIYLGRGRGASTPGWGRLAAGGPDRHADESCGGRWTHRGRQNRAHRSLRRRVRLGAGSNDARWGARFHPAANPRRHRPAAL